MATFTIETQERLSQLAGETTDLGSVFHTVLVAVGEKFGLYRAMLKTGPVTPEGLAQRTGFSKKYVELWLNAQAVGNYLDYDAATGRYCLWSRWPRVTEPVMA